MVIAQFWRGLDGEIACRAISRDGTPMASVTSLIRRWLAPPVLGTLEQRATAQRVNRAIQLISVIISVFLLTLMALQPETAPQRSVALLLFGISALILFEINRRGRPRAAAWGFVVAIGSILTQRTLISGGIHAPATLLFVALVLLAGFLLGERAGMLVGIASAVALLVITLREVYGALPPSNLSYTPTTLWLYTTVAIGLALVLQQLVSRALRDALQKTEAELRERREAEQRLRLALDAGNIGVCSRIHQPGHLEQTTGFLNCMASR
jgi:hypothetical protein